MGRYAHHKYTWTKPWQAVNHSWSLICAKGGVHFHVSLMPGEEASCGLEFHSFTPFHGDNAPNHIDCWLLRAPCWHDGTSLYARETLWPRVEHYLKTGSHEAIFSLLEDEAHRQFFPPLPEQSDD